MQDNNTTLNKDINLIERDCGYWDYEFQYGDLVLSKDKQSLRNGLIIACLTSWNYLNRQGNPTYSEFGNKAYWELKKKKSNMREYLIKQYFIEVLNRIRRVHRIVDIDVINHPTDPNAYNVKFTVEAINNEIVEGNFSIGTEKNLPSSAIITGETLKYASNEQPLNITLTLRNEYGTGIKDEILYMYLQKGNNGPMEFYKACGLTDEQGQIKVTYTPSESEQFNNIYFTFKGNNEYNPSTSDNIIFQSDIIGHFIEFINPNITTNINTATLHLKAYKKSTITDKYEPLQYAVLKITGSDREMYEAITDNLGEVKIQVNIIGDTTFTATYNELTANAEVTIQKTTPVIILEADKFEAYTDEKITLTTYIEDDLSLTSRQMIFVLYDNDEPIKTFTVTDNNEIQIELENLEAGEHRFYIMNEPNGFYEQSKSRRVTDTEMAGDEIYDEEIDILIKKHDYEVIAVTYANR